MNEQELLAKRIVFYCEKRKMSYYTLSNRAAVPLTTLMHIVKCSTRNPGVFTLIKICSGLDITITEFFDSEEFENIEFEIE